MVRNGDVPSRVAVSERSLVAISDREAFDDRHRRMLDLLDAWALGADADVYNLADGVADDPRASCYASTRVLDLAVRLWAADCGLDPALARDRLRSALERQLGRDGPMAAG